MLYGYTQAIMVIGPVRSRDDPLPQSNSEPGVVGKGMDSYLLTWYINDTNSYFYIDAGGNNTNYGIPSAAWSQVTAVFDPDNSDPTARG
mgnify:CR=1 FL=1